MLIRRCAPGRSFSLVALMSVSSVGALAIEACGSGSSSGPPSDVIGDARDGGTTADGGGVTQGDGAASGDGASTMAAHVAGVVVARSDHAPVASRALIVRDAAGKTQNATTDASGAFSFDGVTTPYDLYIAPSGTDSNATSCIYLGVRATKLRVLGDTADLTPRQPKNATAAIAWTTPTCPSGLCRVAIVVRTADGSEVRAQHPGYGPGPRTYPLPVDWPEADTTTTAQATLLLSDSGGGGTFYLASSAVSLTAGQSTQVPLTPSSVPALGASSFSATNTVAGWSNAPSGTVRLALPGQAGELELTNGGMSAPLSFSLPNIAGATISLSASQLSSTAPFNAVGLTSLGLAPAASPYSEALGDPFPIAAPAEKGSVSVATGSVEFHAVTGPRTHVVQWVRLDGPPGAIVWLGDPKLTLSRLAGLGPAVVAAPIQLVVEEHTRTLDDWLTDMTAPATDRSASTSYEASFSP